MCTRLYITPYYPTYLTVVNCALLSKSPIKQLCTLVTLHASLQLGFAKICILLWLLSLFLDSPLNSSLTTFKWRILWNFEAEIIFHMHGSREELESGRTEWMQWTLNHNLYYSWRTRALVLCQLWRQNVWVERSPVRGCNCLNNRLSNCLEARLQAPWEQSLFYLFFLCLLWSSPQEVFGKLCWEMWSACLQGKIY